MMVVLKSSSTITRKPAPYTIIVAIATFLLLLTPLTTAADIGTPTISYTYNCTGSTVYVTVNIEDVAGYTNITIPEDSGVIEESIVAIDQDNNVLPVLVGDGYITIVLGGETSSLTINYVLLVESYGDFYMLGINPTGKATIILPVNASLRYASDSPEAYVNTSRITLSYSGPGSYIIYYTITENPQPSPPSTTTTHQIPPTGTGTTSQTGRATATTTTRTAGYTGKWSYTLLITMALLAAVALYWFTKSRRRPPQPGSGEDTGIEVVIDSVSLDERDRLLLDLISKEEHTVSSLSRASGLSKSVVWRRIKKMESLGLVETSKDVGRAYIRLTNKGRKLLEDS